MEAKDSLDGTKLTLYTSKYHITTIERSELEVQEIGYYKAYNKIKQRHFIVLETIFEKKCTT